MSKLTRRNILGGVGVTSAGGLVSSKGMAANAAGALHQNNFNLDDKKGRVIGIEEVTPLTSISVKTVDFPVGSSFLEELTIEGPFGMGYSPTAVLYMSNVDTIHDGYLPNDVLINYATNKDKYFCNIGQLTQRMPGWTVETKNVSSYIFSSESRNPDNAYFTFDAGCVMEKHSDAAKIARPKVISGDQPGIDLDRVHAMTISCTEAGSDSGVLVEPAIWVKLSTDPEHLWRKSTVKQKFPLAAKVICKEIEL